MTESKVTLKVPKCTKEDTGEYTLKLKNKWGEAESSVSRMCNNKTENIEDHLIISEIFGFSGILESSIETGN